MSYCRWSDGDLYVVSGPPLSCMKCPLVAASVQGHNDFEGTKVEMLAHLREHQAAEHAFPVHAIMRLEAEIDEEARTGEPSSFYGRALP